MLDEISTRVPSVRELDQLGEGLVRAVGRLDTLEMSLERLGVQPDGSFHSEPLTAEEAWRLTRAAEDCQRRA